MTNTDRIVKVLRETEACERCIRVHGTPQWCAIWQAHLCYDCARKLAGAVRAECHKIDDEAIDKTLGGGE